MFVNSSVKLAVLIGTTYGAYLAYEEYRLKSFGSIHAEGIEVYKDASLTEELTTIDWGTLKRGQSAYYSCYILNPTFENITLDIFVENYEPSDSDTYLILSWTYEETTILQPNDVINMQIYLTVLTTAPNLQEFNHEIVINAIPQT